MPNASSEIESNIVVADPEDTSAILTDKPIISVIVSESGNVIVSRQMLVSTESLECEAVIELVQSENRDHVSVIGTSLFCQVEQIERIGVALTRPVSIFHFTGNTIPRSTIELVGKGEVFQQVAAHRCKFIFILQSIEKNA